MEEEKRNWKRNKDKWERVTKKKAGEQEQGYMWTLECILLLTKTRPFHEGLNLGHECRILPVCLPPIWCSIIHCWGGCSLYCTGQLPLSLPLSLSLSLSPSLSLSLSSHLSQTQSRTHKLLPLPASGFKAQLWRIHCDSTGFRAHWRRGREGEREMAMGGEKGVAWRRRQMNQREEKQQRWQQNQHHCIPSWHNWLYQRRFCKPLTSPLRVTRLHCNTGFERPHVCVCVCVYVCIMHDRVLAGVFSCGMFVVCIHWFILALSSGEICCGNQLGSRWVRLTTHEQERWVVCDNEMCCMLLYHSALQRQAAVTTEAVRLKWCEVLLGQSAHKLREKKK